MGLIRVYCGCFAYNGSTTVRLSLCKTRLTLPVLQGIVCECVWCGRPSVCVWFGIRPAHLGPNTIIPKITESQLKHACIRQNTKAHAKTCIQKCTLHVEPWPDSAEVGDENPLEISDDSLQFKERKKSKEKKKQNPHRKKVLKQIFWARLLYEDDPCSRKTPTRHLTQHRRTNPFKWKSFFFFFFTHLCSSGMGTDSRRSF